MNRQARQRRNCIGRTGWLNWAWLLLLPGTALADVREPGRIRLARESLLPALPGQPYSGVVEFTSPQDGVVEDVEIGGVGWEVKSVELANSVNVQRGETIRFPFQADVKDGVGKLEIRVTVSGKVVEKKFDLSPERIAAIGKDRASTRVDDAGGVSQSEGTGGPGPRGCDDYLLRVHGRIEYVRPDGQVVGVDNIRFQIMDEDTVDSEVIYEGQTDEQGWFDVTTCWDDCDISGCDDPDVYLRYECNTGVAFVRNDDAGEDIYAWSTIDTLIFNDFGGGDVDFGNQRPTDTATFPALHIHNSMVRAHRYVAETSGFVSGQVGVVWQDGNGAFYRPSENEIHIGPDEQWNEGTQVHEWGHHLLYEWTSPVSPSYCNGFCDDPAVSACGGEMCVGNGGHCVWCQETDTDAWNEGFPNWLGSVVMRIWQGRYSAPPPTALNDGRYTLEDVQACCNGIAHNAFITEGFVAALLRDIEDPPQDVGQTACPQDALALNGDEILAIVRQYQPIRVTEFMDRFRTAYPQYEHDFRSTAQSVAATYVVGWVSPPLQVSFTNGCGAYRNGETITLSVQTNASRFSTCMQWQRDGLNVIDGGRVSGATTDTLVITDAGGSDAGRYTLRITSCDGATTPCNGTQITTSPPIAVRVIDANPPAHRVTGWGNNYAGALGRGTLVPATDVNPGYVINLNNVIAVTAGQLNSHAILSDGAVWGWGYRYLGDGTNQNSATPVQATGLTNIVAVSGGGVDGNTMALDGDGHVWTWGGWGYAQLGNPLTINALSPIQVDLECVVDISMGDHFVAAVTGDGSLWIWGSDVYGQAGLGAGQVQYWTPQRVTDLSNVVDVDVGAYHTLVRLADGTTWAAGWNEHGQLGDGTVVNRNRFVQVIGLSNVTQISAGWAHSLAVRSDSTPWGWGAFWAVGTGSNLNANPTPAPILNLPTVRSLDAGNEISAFVDEHGTIWTCGVYQSGQLCRPTGIAREPLPIDTRVGAAVQVSAGGAFMMAIAPGARIITPVMDQIAAGCATARLTVGAIGEPPLSYQWSREYGTVFEPLNDDGAYSGTTTPTLTIPLTGQLFTGRYRVAVANATNVAFGNPVTLVTPPLLNAFDTPEDASLWWNNERGNWAITDGAYAAVAPDSNPPTYSSFRLPLTDFQIELDVTNTPVLSSGAAGGIWLRSRVAPARFPGHPEGVLLGFGSVGWGGYGHLYWQRWPESPQNLALNAYTPGQPIHLRVEVRGNVYAAYLNDSPTPTTTLTNAEYPSGSIGLHDNADVGAAYDNVFIQSLTSCDPGSGMEPVRIIQRPLSQAVASGSPVMLSVSASGTGPLGYQWLRNGSCVAGANSATYSFTASAATAGRHECTVTNACGSVGSFPATVSVEGGGPPGDIDGDGHVGLQDLTVLLSSFGLCAGDPGYVPAADLGGDGCVGLQDLAVLLANFGS